VIPKLNQYYYVSEFFYFKFSRYLLSKNILDGEHTTVKTVVTSKVGGLASFITRKDKCIGCKTVLQEQGKEFYLPLNSRYSEAKFVSK
jgi:hypothetical protein